MCGKYKVVLLFLVTALLGAQPAQNQDKPDFVQEARAHLETRPDYAFELAKRAQEYGRLNNEPHLQAEGNLLLGRLFSDQSAFNHALVHLLNCLELLETIDAPGLQAEAYNELGKLYHFLRRDEKVLSTHRRAARLYQMLEDTAGLAETYGYIGHYYEKQENYDSASAFQQRALAILPPNRYPALSSKIFSHIGSIYEDLQDYPVAEDYFLRGLALNDSSQHPSQRMTLLNNLGDVTFQQGRYQEAEAWMHRTLALAQLKSDNYQLRSVLRDLSQVYAAQGQYDRAYALLDSSVTYFKKIYSEDGLKQVANLEAFFETEKKEREIRLLEQDHKINRLIISLVLAGMISSIAIGGLLVHRQRSQMRQKQVLFAAQEKLMKAQLENKSRSLTNYSLHLIEKNQFLQQLQQQLKTLSRPEATPPKKKLHSLSRDIDTNLSQEKGWENFRQTFEVAHPDFFRQLSRQNPRLTHADLKLAALMKMHLESKEIAGILGISTDSLRVARYRLRKKLALDKKTQLAAFLHSL